MPVGSPIVTTWLGSLDWLAAISLGLQLLVLGTLSFVVYRRFFRGSQAEPLLKGLFITLLGSIGLWGIARTFGLALLELVFGTSIQLLLIGLIVIFQPELRRILLYLGQPERFTRNFMHQVQPGQLRTEKLIKTLCDVARHLSRQHTGALIVVELTEHPTQNTLEAGTELNAALSPELLLTIFHPNTPLHDGAIIINHLNRVVAAGVLLPLTEDPNLSWQYGTRHRAAIGMSETSDCLCLVVSEENGIISLVQQGTIKRLLRYDDLRPALEERLIKQDEEKGLNGLAQWSERWLNWLTTGIKEAKKNISPSDSGLSKKGFLSKVPDSESGTPGSIKV